MYLFIKGKADFVKILLRHKTVMIIIGLLLLHIFLRFYAIETKSIFSWDQVDSAWAAKQIIVDHNYPLVGPENKQGSGVFIGPLYYYLASFFYLMTSLDPIAAGLLAGASSIIGFFVLFFIAKKLFSTKVALIALFINTASISSIGLERVQWEVNFIPAFFLLAFYFLYRILTGNEKSIIYLSVILALAFHIHLTTAVFLPIVILCTLPFFPKNKKTLRYIMISTPIFIAGIFPIIIAYFLKNNSYSENSLSYVSSSFHGLYLTRVMQLFSTAFIQIESYFIYPAFKSLSFLLLPAFFIIYFLNIPTKKKFTMTALIFLMFLIPWITLSVYNGEITDYYFSANRFIGLIVIAYMIHKLLELKNKLITLLIVIIACAYAYINIGKFLTNRTVGLQNYRAIVKDHIKNGKIIEYKQGSPLSYLYYIYTRKQQFLIPDKSF